MKKIKLFTLLATAALFTATELAAQSVSVSNGPDLNSNRDNNMNRMMDGDETSFYAYRVRSKGKGTSFYVEKYDKASMKQTFSKEVDLGEAGTKLEDVFYGNKTVYVFSRQYDKKMDKMTLNVQTVSSDGVVNPKKDAITSVTSDHYEFVEFDIASNPQKNKFIIKACHKPNKDAAYKTEFHLFNTATMKLDWTKNINGKMFTTGDKVMDFGMFKIKTTAEFQFLGMELDKDDNIFYCYMEEAKNSTEKERRKHLKLAMFNSKANEPHILQLDFDDTYYVSDIEFSRTKSSEIVVGGFLKDVIERRGRDLVKTGIFSFTVNTESFTVSANPVKFFDDNMLKALEMRPKDARSMFYKLDYIMPIGADVYYIGQQYQVIFVRSSSGGFGGAMMQAATGMGGGTFNYKYMDVIVAKLNAKGQFEWVSNAPLRNNVNGLMVEHCFKQYFAVPTEKNIFIYNNDHPKNLARYAKADFEPKDLGTVTGIHGSSFVFSSVSLATGKVVHKLVFENDTYCFATVQERNPQFMPPEEAEIFVPEGKNAVIVYTEDKGKDRFTKLTMKD